MKKRILLFTAAAALGYVTLTSYDDGPALHGQNRTGARNSTANCSTGGCHGTGAGTTVTLEADSATTSTAVTSYAPGKVYTIKIHGTNTSSYAHYGFQFASVKGTGGTQTQAGTSSALPSGVTTHTTSSLSIVEHSTVLTTATAGTYDISFTWTAPAAGAGSVTLYTILNAVNGDGTQNAADVAAQTSIVLTEQAPATGVNTISSDIAVTAYPNPVTTDLNIAMANAASGEYALSVYDLNGRAVAQQTVTANNASLQANLNASAWATGMYMVVLQKDGMSHVVKVVKN